MQLPPYYSLFCIHTRAERIPRIWHLKLNLTLQLNSYSFSNEDRKKRTCFTLGSRREIKVSLTKVWILLQPGILFRDVCSLPQTHTLHSLVSCAQFQNPLESHEVPGAWVGLHKPPTSQQDTSMSLQPCLHNITGAVTSAPVDKPGNKSD